MSDLEEALPPKEIKTINPFEEMDEGLEYLELDNIPERVANPFLEYPIGAQLPNPVEEMVGMFVNPNYLHFAARMILGVDLPPYQVAILDILWNRKLPILVGSRGAAKSFILGVYCLLRMVFHPGCRVVIVGNGLRQARQVFDYMSSIWEKAPILRDIAGKSKTAGPRRETDRYQFELGDSRCFAIPLGDGSRIRGLRANYILADEMASINEEIFNLVVQGFAVVASSPIEKIKEASMVKKLKELGKWSPEMEALRIEMSSGNQIIYSGTAFYTFNHFYKRFKKWHEIITSKGDSNKLKVILGDDDRALKGLKWQDYAIIRLPYTHVPEGMLDEGILAQAKATLSHAQFLMEFGAVFAGDSDGFYRRSIIEAATTNKPILTTSGKLVQFHALMEGRQDKSYVIGVDPAADTDNAAITVIELEEDHRRIVHCWTTNKKKYSELKKYMEAKGEEISEDYYRFIARKIRSLMRVFNTERIVMDKHGGGTAIAEALSSFDTCEAGEKPIYTIIDPDDPKPDDIKKGLHILELLIPSQDLNSEANHGMLKDFQDRVLLFPLFTTIEVAKGIELDKINAIEFDNFENLYQEIEDLKNEITTIVVTPSSTLGKESFDTPSVKSEGQKRGRLRKDRYSALLYANYYARNRDKDKSIKIEYKAYGGLKQEIKQRQTVDGENHSYYGPGILSFSKDNKPAQMGIYGRAIHRK